MKDEQSVYDSTLNANDQLKVAVEQAEKENKLILLQIGGNWCCWCIILDNLMKSDELIKKELEDNYILLHIDSQSNTDFTKQYAPQLKHYPWLSVLNSQGDILVEQPTGNLEKGRGHDPQLVLDFLKGNTIIGEDSPGQIGPLWKK